MYSISKEDKVDFLVERLTKKSLSTKDFKNELKKIFKIQKPTSINLELNSDVIDYNELDNEVHYDLVPEKDRIKVDLQVSYRVLSKTVNSLERLKKQLDFAGENIKKFKSLTQQELQVLKMVCEGLSSKEVAIALFIEPSTVATHRKKINRKLEAKSCVDLYRYATAFNLIEF